MAGSINKLEAVLKNYSLEDLCNIALQEFPETTWDEIRNHIVDRREVISRKNVIKLLVDTVKENISKNDIDNRICTLKLIAVCKSNKKIWISFQLMDRTKVSMKVDMLENIKSCITRTGMRANVDLIKYNNKNVLRIEKKIIAKKSGIRKQGPIFFQFFSSQPYLFCTRKRIETKLMNAVVESLGYSNWKICNLNGPNINDLLTILKNKRYGTNAAPLLFPEPEPTPTFKITEAAIEFGQMEQRRKYAEKLYGKNPPQLQRLSVSLKNCKWQQVGDFDKMNGTSLDGVTLTFCVPNIAELFKEMITMGIVDKPVPEYIKSVLHTGKNELKITQNN